MTDYVQKLLPRFRYGVIQPRAHEDVQRARSYQLYRLLPLDFWKSPRGLGSRIIRRKALRERSRITGLVSTGWLKKRLIILSLVARRSPQC